MSIKAMNWALDQATGDPRAQCLLYVVADTANEEGVAWPSADWMAVKSQQSRATVYRRLSQLQELGLLVLFPRYIDADGKVWNAQAPGRRRTSPEIRLQLGVFIKQNGQPPEDESDDETAEGQSQAETGVVSPVRQGLSHCCDSKNPHLNQESPQSPPSGGDDVVEVEFEKFKEAYPIPIVNLGYTRQLFGALTADERAKAIEGAAAYGRFCKAEKRRHTDAHRWLRKRDWESFVGKGAPATSKPRVFVPETSDAAKAWKVFEACYGRQPLAVQSNEHRCSGYWVETEFPPFGRDLELDEWNWLPIEKGLQQWHAWQERLREYRGQGSPSRQMTIDGRVVQGWKFPTEWPPVKHPKDSTTTTTEGR